jgi:hypothetical protein
MAFIREKKVNGRSYFYLVQSFREVVGGRSVVRQKLIRYIGTRRPKGPQRGLLPLSRRIAALRATPVLAPERPVGLASGREASF